MRDRDSAWSDGTGWGFSVDDDYGNVFYKRATGQLPEMESSKAAARRIAPHLKAEGSMLDVGCGGGHYLPSLIRQIGLPFIYKGTDLTPAYINLANEAFADRKNVSFEVANVFDLPFKDKSFDVSMCNNVFLHLRAIEHPLKEICRVSKDFVLIRTLIGERSFLIQEVRSDGDEFNEVGDPKAFNYYNIFSQNYFTHLLDRVPRVKSFKFFEDKDFDPAKIDQSISDHTQAKNATKMLGDWQLNHYILQPWHFIEIELDE